MKETAAKNKRPSDRQSEVAVASGPRRLSREEFPFEALEEAEYDACFRYEIRRERAERHRVCIMEELRLIDLSNDPENDRLRHMLDLQDELQSLEREARPWLDLSEVEKRALVMAGTEKAEPVRLASEVIWIERRAPKYVAGAKEDLTISVDFTQSLSQLTESFSRLIKRLRQAGRSKFEISKRGRPTSIELLLFGLAVQRCVWHGIPRNQAWDRLATLRQKLCIGEDKKYRLASLQKEIDRLVDRIPA